MGVVVFFPKKLGNRRILKVRFLERVFLRVWVR